MFPTIRKIPALLVTIYLTACTLPSPMPVGKMEGGSVLTEKNTPSDPLIDRNEMPVVSISSKKSVSDAKECLITQLKTNLNLPDNFFTVAQKKENYYIMLNNPYSNTKGMILKILPKGQNSQIDLFANGVILVSNTWKKLPASCK